MHRLMILKNRELTYLSIGDHRVRFRFGDAVIDVLAPFAVNRHGMSAPNRECVQLMLMQLIGLPLTDVEVEPGERIRLQFDDTEIVVPLVTTRPGSVRITTGIEEPVEAW